MSDVTFIILDETTETVTVDVDGHEGDNLDHLFCCDPDVALCGTDISDVELTAFDYDDNPELCVVCHDLEFAICRRCGS